MNQMLSIVQTISDSNPNNWPKLYSSLNEHQSFRHKSSQELEPIISHISNLLNDIKTKHQGLLLLRTFLPQCQLDTFELKGTLWITMCTKVCAQRKPEECVPVAYEILGELIKKSIHIPELGKAVSGNLLIKIFETIFNLNRNGGVNENDEQNDLWSMAALKFMEIAMKTFAGTSGIGKSTTEKFILNFVDSQNKELVRQSGKCLLMLQQTRGGSGGGSGNTMHKTIWSQLQMSLMWEMNDILNKLYVNTSEIHSGVEYGTDRLPLNELLLSDEPLAKTMQLMIRFKNLNKWLQIALIEPFPVAKQIQPIKMLALISRGLAVNCITLASKLITDNIVVGAILPEIHVSLFDLLDVLILVLRGNMLMFSNTVNQLIIQSLKWTSSGKANGSKRPYSSIRCAAYRTLSIWCRTASYGSCTEDIAEELVHQILQDITPFQNEVTLKVLNGTSKKHLSKKARKNLHKTQNEATNLAQTHSKSFNAHNTKIIYSDRGNEAICCAALESLIELFKSAGCFIKPVIHKIIHEQIIVLIVQILETPTNKKYSTDATNIATNLYENDQCRGSLYGALHALVIGAHHLCPPPVQYAAKLFSLAYVRDLSPIVRQLNGSYLKTIEKILHPQKETIYIPAELSQLKDAMKTDGLKLLANNQEDDDDDDDEMEINLTNEIANNVNGEKDKVEENVNVMAMEEETVEDEEDDNVYDDEQIDDVTEPVKVLNGLDIQSIIDVKSGVELLNNSALSAPQQPLPIDESVVDEVDEPLVVIEENDDDEIGEKLETMMENTVLEKNNISNSSADSEKTKFVDLTEECSNDEELEPPTLLPSSPQPSTSGVKNKIVNISDDEDIVDGEPKTKKSKISDNIDLTEDGELNEDEFFDSCLAAFNDDLKDLKDH